MNIKEILGKLGILKVGANAGTYKNAQERSELVTEDPIDTQSTNSSAD
jgi:hypothetical protein